MSLLDLIFKTKTSVVSVSNVKNKDGVFRTSSIGGISVDVSSLLDSTHFGFESYAKNSYLKKFVINKNGPKIGNYVVMICNFGIVNNSHYPFSEEEELSRCITYQFRDARKFMYDPVMKDDIRINNIERANSFVFSCLS